jgi:hypothetical protein
MTLPLLDLAVVVRVHNINKSMRYAIWFTSAVVFVVNS